MARQQRFLQDLRQQAMSWNNLMFRLPGLVGALLPERHHHLGAKTFSSWLTGVVKLDPGRIQAGGHDRIDPHHRSAWDDDHPSYTAMVGVDPVMTTCFIRPGPV